MRLCWASAPFANSDSPSDARNTCMHDRAFAKMSSPSGMATIEAIGSSLVQGRTGNLRTITVRLSFERSRGNIGRGWQRQKRSHLRLECSAEIRTCRVLPRSGLTVSKEDPNARPLLPRLQLRADAKVPCTEREEKAKTGQWECGGG